MAEKIISMNKEDLIKLSRTVSHALRHAPEEYGLSIDSSGWVEISILLNSLSSKHEQWKNLTKDDLHSMAAAGEKKRYEISEFRIRAIYGHSTSTPVEYEESTPPNLLYHGTTEKSAALIRKEGLKPMKRQYVHLSADVDTATHVALRRTSNPVLVIIDAKAAYSDGTKFYKGNDSVWLAKSVDKKFIE